MRSAPFLLLFLFILASSSLPLDAANRPPRHRTWVAQGDVNQKPDAAFEEDLFEEEELTVFDPLEPVNRGIFWFNDKFYFYLLKPVAKAYRVVPESARVSVSNFFSNLYTPIRFANALLQCKLKDSGTELARFLINTTIGIGGLFDPAKRYTGMQKKEEDFGQTLGRYRTGPGPYLVIPFIGPSNLRDGIGRVADAFLDPVYYLNTSAGGQVAIKAFDEINFVSLDKDTYEGIKKEALDPYLFVRDAYTQKRQGEISK